LRVSGLMIVNFSAKKQKMAGKLGER
jgi:hypothetical protein